VIPQTQLVMEMTVGHGIAVGHGMTLVTMS